MWISVKVLPGVRVGGRIGGCKRRRRPRRPRPVRLPLGYGRHWTVDLARLSGFYGAILWLAGAAVVVPLWLLWAGAVALVRAVFATGTTDQKG